MMVSKLWMFYLVELIHTQRMREAIQARVAELQEILGSTEWAANAVRHLKELDPFVAYLDSGECEQTWIRIVDCMSAERIMPDWHTSYMRFRGINGDEVLQSEWFNKWLEEGGRNNPPSKK